MALLKAIPLDKNLKARILSSVILAPIVLLLIHFGSIFYKALILLMAILMAFEWNALTSKNDDKSAILWKVVGILYILLPCISLIWIREQARGAEITYWMIGVIWCTDIGAYFSGRIIGGWKIAPTISPNKTWAGLIGGTLLACVFGYYIGLHNQTHHLKPLVSLTAVLAVYSQIGDLIESWIKRKFGAKDSGSVIPGHGGIMDRVDGIVPVAPKVAMVVLFDRWGIF